MQSLHKLRGPALGSTAGSPSLIRLQSGRDITRLKVKDMILSLICVGRRTRNWRADRRLLASRPKQRARHPCYHHSPVWPLLWQELSLHDQYSFTISVSASCCAVLESRNSRCLACFLPAECTRFQIFHPSVNHCGQVFVRLLLNWSPVLSIGSVLRCLLAMLLVRFVAKIDLCAPSDLFRSASEHTTTSQSR